jgi:hypothetical protein
MQLTDLRRRVERLDELADGLAREVALWGGGDDLLLSRERKAYLGAVQQALAGAELARRVLANAVRRLEGR